MVQNQNNILQYSKITLLQKSSDAKGIIINSSIT